MLVLAQDKKFPPICIFTATPADSLNVAKKTDETTFSQMEDIGRYFLCVPTWFSKGLVIVQATKFVTGWYEDEKKMMKKIS